MLNSMIQEWVVISNNQAERKRIQRDFNAIESELEIVNTRG
jgi:hypothetical protein